MIGRRRETLSVFFPSFLRLKPGRPGTIMTGTLDTDSRTGDDPRMARRFLPLLLAVTVGCAGGAADVVPVDDAGADASIVPDCIPRPAGWLEHSLEDWSPDEAESCLVLAGALSDESGSWLWVHVDLAEGAVVRVDGPGCLEATLRDGDRTWTVRDLGLHVPLHRDGNAYLNSQGGPITIRAHHGLAADRRGVRFLARLPRVDADRVEVVGLTPVAGSWCLRP